MPCTSTSPLSAKPTATVKPEPMITDADVVSPVSSQAMSGALLNVATAALAMHAYGSVSQKAFYRIIWTFSVIQSRQPGTGGTNISGWLAQHSVIDYETRHPQLRAEVWQFACTGKLHGGLVQCFAVGLAKLDVDSDMKISLQQVAGSTSHACKTWARSEFKWPRTASCRTVWVGGFRPVCWCNHSGAVPARHEWGTGWNCHRPLLMWRLRWWHQHSPNRIPGPPHGD